MPNRLASSTSPYLLQHADNPVDWFEWGEDAFAEARRRDVPILLSVGYAACHWCHVMAHESFEDPAVAAVMNETFVNVKVDREERPDVDAVYMEATQSLTGHGGWPMTVFMTADGEPFYAGTYFPPEPRHGMPSFPQLLGAIGESWRDKRADVVAAAAEITSRLSERTTSGSSGAEPPTADQLDAAAESLAGTLDQANGGFGGAPKFPPSMALEFLLRHHARTGSMASRASVGLTCERMARGGLYDQLGGGFARYSVDARWIVPHFEKMLYDNALLLRVYLHWWRATDAELAQRVVVETAGFLLRDLRTAQGGFASSLDADTEGHEGLFYAWTPQQLVDVLGPEDGAWAAAAFEVTGAGTFEHGSSVLQRLTDPEDEARHARVRAQLFDAREQRTRPGRDDKVVAAWNGLAIAALAEAGALFDRRDWLEAAVAAGDLLVSLHLDGDRLVRTSRDGVAGSTAGVLEDYASVAEGFLTLFAVTGEESWLTFAGVLLDVVLDQFPDGDGGFYDTAADAEALVRRPQDPTDNATPAGQSAAAAALLSYAAYTGSERRRSAAEAALGATASFGTRHPRFAGWGLAAAEALLDGPREIAVVGDRTDPVTGELRLAALRSTAPGAVLAVADPSDGPSGVALLADRPLVDGRPAAYVCRHFTCDAPVTTAEALARALRGPTSS